MKKRNIWKKNFEKSLETHEDDRGTIQDIFYKSEIKHVAIIVSKPNAIRGNHYHKDSIQHILITKGSLEYWYKKLDSDEKSQSIIIREGDMITTQPYEIHALKILENGCEFIAFSEGLRGGKDYEKDTFRVESIINK